MKLFKPLVPLSLLFTAISPVFAEDAREAASDPFDFEPAPAIWKLADEDTTIYIFGTIHLLPKDLKWRTEKFNDIVNSVDSLVVETSDDDFEESDTAANLISSMIENADREPLLERVKPENREALKELAEYIEMPLDFLDFMPVWMVPFSVYFKSIEEAEAAGEFGTAYGVETILEAEFKAMEKPIDSIEDSDAILTALSDLPDVQQLKMVDEMLDGWRTEGLEKTLGHQSGEKSKENNYGIDYTDYISWAKGQDVDLPADLTEDALGGGFYKVLLNDRNAAWAIWLKNRLEQPGEILLAVGSGHLLGKDSVQNKLTEKGLKVERLQ